MNSPEGGGDTAAPFPLSGADLLLALLLTAGALALRLPFIAPHPQGWDSIDFALALARYDLLAMQPHFPGYPVFIWLGRLAQVWQPDPFLALAGVSAAAGALAIGAACLLGTAMGGRTTGLATAAWLALSPLAWLISGQAMSDSLGLLGCILFLLAAWRYHRTGRTWPAALSGLALGLTLGVRLSYFPLGLTLLVLVLRRRSWRGFGAALLGGLAGMVPWLLWLVAREGAGRLLELGVRFTGGHLTDWGGAVGAPHAAAARGHLFHWRNWLGLGLGGPAVHPLPGWGVLLLLGVGLGLGWRRLDARFTLAWLLPYLAWAYWGQNPDNPRHLVPILPVVMLYAARGLRELRMPLRWAAGLLLSGALAAAALPLVRAQAAVPPPMVRLAHYLRQERTAPVFVWEEERAIKYYSPGVTVFRLRRPAHFEQVLFALPHRPQRVLATSAFLNGLGEAGTEIRRHFRPVAQFQGDPLIYTTYHDITLYEAGPDLYAAFSGPRR